jgi:hypothetical protein
LGFHFNSFLFYYFLLKKPCFVYCRALRFISGFFLPYAQQTSFFAMPMTRTISTRLIMTIAMIAAKAAIFSGSLPSGYNYSNTAKKYCQYSIMHY